MFDHVQAQRRIFSVNLPSAPFPLHRLQCFLVFFGMVFIYWWWLFVFALLANINEILLWDVSVLFFFLEEGKNCGV